MDVLVVGAGVAGLVAATLLAQQGHGVTLMEREPRLRTEGYMLDFFGPGFDVAERLGLLPAFEAIHYPVEELVFVDAAHRRRGAIDYERLRMRALRGRHFNFMRGDLERVLHGRLPAEVVQRYGDSPRSIEHDGTAAWVATEQGLRARFDLVVGADGVRSRVRALAFPPEATRELPVGCDTAAWIVDGRPECLPERTFVSLAETGINVAGYPIRGGRTATFFVHASAERLRDRSPAACRAALEQAFRGRGVLPDALLDTFPASGDVYYDEVLQIELACWSQGPVVLVGDACGAVSLVAGQGASMAVAGAWVLAQEISRRPGDLRAALLAYEARVLPAVLERQKSGRRNAGWFLPRSHFRAVVRDHATDLLLKSPFARMIVSAAGGRSIPLE